MNDTHPKISVRDAILLEGAIDYISASWVYGVAKDAGMASSEDTRDLAIGVIAELISTGLMLPGGFQGPGFVPWNCSAGEAIHRVASRWVVEGNPNPLADEITWLSSTPLGDAAAEDIRAIGSTHR
ncbi:hypothetical protein [Microbacterium phyllosphaerae]|uniref:hypothetical protein n=1 Tax=Microbacterium phyllosphaerae TaxID=124798 RepID=UPI003D649EA5